MEQLPSLWPHRLLGDGQHRMLRILVELAEGREMDPSPPTWPQRFLRAIPPFPDRVWVGMFCLLLFLCGMVVGLTLRRPQPVDEGRRLTLQHQLDALDTRLKALKSR